MSGVKGMKGHCTGMTDKEVADMVAFQYEQFCRYRNEIYNGMPDRRTGLFNSRAFDGRYFETE